MGFIHDTNDNYFGLEERGESFVILFGADREEHGIFIYADKNFSGGIELTPERIADLKKLLNHPAIIDRLFDSNKSERTSVSKQIRMPTLENADPVMVSHAFLNSMADKTAQVETRLADSTHQHRLDLAAWRDHDIRLRLAAQISAVALRKFLGFGPSTELEKLLIIKPHEEGLKEVEL